MTPESLRIALVRDVLTGRFTESKNETALKGIDEEYFDIYQIPASWDIVTLKDCCYLHARIGWQALRKDEHQSQGDYLLITGTDFKNGFVDYSTCVYVSKERYDMDEKIKLQNDDILVTKDGSIGKVAVVKNLPKPATLNAGVFVVRPDDRFEKRYIEYLFQCSYFSRFVNLVKSGSTIKHLNQNKLQQFKIPVPSKREQIEIVEILDNWLPKIDVFEQLDHKLNTLNVSFPEMMKKSILQEAVQGKLVPQDPNDEPASVLLEKIADEKKKLIKEGKIKKQKPLPEITEDEIPFDIPDSWEWCYVGDLFDHNTGKAMNSSAKQGNKKGSVRRFITTSNLYWNRFDLSTVKEMFFSDDELARCTATKRDILMCEGGAYFGRTAIWDYDYDICFQNHVHRLRPYVKIKEEFFYYLFYLYRTTGLMKSKGTAMPGLSSVALHGLVIPLPPLAEQERIVSKIEKLLPRVEKLSL